MIKRDIELIDNKKYADLKTQKIKGLCQRYHLAALTEYTYEIAMFKATNPDPDQVKHPGNKIFRAEIAIKLFYETYKEELNMIKGCKEEMEGFYK